MRASRFYSLLLVTLLAGAALLALILTEERAAQAPDGLVAAFPLLAEDPGAAASIRITGSAEVELRRSAAAGLWLLPEKGGYPAETARVGKLLNELAGMTLFEAKTATADNLDLLDLAGAEAGPRVQIFDAGGVPLVDAIIGKGRENLGRVGVIGTYLRYADADQAWLALGAPVLPRSALAMVDQTLLRLPGSVIARVEVTAPDSGTPLVAQRRERTQSSFALEPLPAVGSGVNEAALGTLAGALQLLVFDDVRPAEDLPFEQPWRAVFTSFDGIKITLTFVRHQAALWARVSTAAVPPPGSESDAVREDAAAFAAGLAAESDGWVYRLNPQLFATLAKRRSAVTTAPSE